MGPVPGAGSLGEPPGGLAQARCFQRPGKEGDPGGATFRAAAQLGWGNAMRFLSQDAAEGLRSFTERREARFTGH
jgi:hypothetical protein